MVSEQQLERLLLLLVGTDFNRGDISWGGAWAQYSLTCMLQDILAGVFSLLVVRVTSGFRAAYSTETSLSFRQKKAC